MQIVPQMSSELLLDSTKHAWQKEVTPALDVYDVLAHANTERLYIVKLHCVFLRSTLHSHCMRATKWRKPDMHAFQ
jgi:hypothetical protein